MCKDENAADSDVCFSDIWAAAQRTRSQHFRALVAKAWRMMSEPVIDAKRERPHKLPSDAHKEVGA